MRSVESVHMVQNRLFLMLNCCQQRVEIVRVSGGFFFSDPELIRDRIFAIQSPVRKGPETSVPVFPPSPVWLRRGERADFLLQFTKAVGGDVILNRKNHTTGVHLFAGRNALKTHTCTASLDTGSPASFNQEKVWLRMLVCGAASEDSLSRVEDKSWGGFHGTPFITSRRVRSCAFERTSWKHW